MQRPTWDQWFAELCLVISKRSTCLRRQHGAIIVRDKRILSTGYNGAPPQVYNCSDVETCFRQTHNIPSGQQYEKCRALHAEENAIIQAAKHGVSIQGGILYVTETPCPLCTKKIHSVGLKEIVAIRRNTSYESTPLNDFTMYGGLVRYLFEEEK